MKNFFKGLLVTVVMAAIITLSLFGGYKFITGLRPDVKEQFDVYTDPIVEKINEELSDSEEQEEVAEIVEEGTESIEQPDPDKTVVTDKRDNDGPVLYQAAGSVFNSEGKKLEGFTNTYGSNINRMVKSIDGTEAVFSFDHNWYYVDADLNVTKLDEDITFAGVCFDGGYYFYVKAYDSHDEVYIHDIENDTDYRITDRGRIHCVCISPDGRTVVYNYSSDKRKLFVKGIDTKEKSYKELYCDTAVSVSNDGETIFYYNDDTNNTYYCLDHGKSVKLGYKKPGRNYLDRNCKQMLYKDTEGRIKYYSAGEKSPVVLIDDSSAKMVMSNVAMQQQDLYMDEFMVDTDSLCDAVMITTSHGCYAVSGSNMDLIELTEACVNAGDYTATVNEEGHCCLYVKDSSLHKIVYDGESITDTVVCEFENGTVYYTCNNDFSKIWALNDECLYYVEEGAKPIVILDLAVGGVFTTHNIYWDPTNDLCYFNVYRALYCVDKTPDTMEVVMEQCSGLSYLSEDNKLVNPFDANAMYYVIINKEALRVK